MIDRSLIRTRRKPGRREVLSMSERGIWSAVAERSGDTALDLSHGWRLERPGTQSAVAASLCRRTPNQASAGRDSEIISGRLLPPIHLRIESTRTITAAVIIKAVSEVLM